MTTELKENVLQTLRLMLADWQSVNEGTTEVEFINSYVRKGFCFWTNNKMDDYNHIKLIIAALYKDVNLIQKMSPYLYPVFYYGDLFTIETIFKILQPRIHHLKKTITRLESELVEP